MNPCEPPSKIAHRINWTSFSEVPKEDWEQVTAGKNLYLSWGYLQSLESAMEETMRFNYSISYDVAGKPVLAAVFQMVQFIDKRRAYSSSLCKLSYHVSKKIAEVFTINVLVCGNVFSDGENGFVWTDDLSSEEAMDEVENALIALKERPSVKENASITLFKDFWSDKNPIADRLSKYHYRGFMIDVNMVLHIADDWKTMDDYLGSMKTKFRTRAKSVFKKAEALRVVSMDAAQIRAHKDRIQELFGNVLEKSDFSFGKLNVLAFAAFDESLGNAFSFRGFFLENQLVGFSTAFLNNGNLEANYVGLDYNYNVEHCVYQRILYDYVEQALAQGVKELQLGRTAEQIKSTIGAIPVNMKLYAKHRRSVPNLLLKPIIRSLTPSEFELRQPFKTTIAG